jgi:TraM recognition site of TraD and TraG
MFNWLRRRRGRATGGRGWDLSTPLLDWTMEDSFTIGHAVEGTLVLGATGSGKTSGSGRALALSFLRAGFGGLVLTAKPDERRVWEGYCRETGRLGDLIVFGPEGAARFNFLDHELTRKGLGAGLTDNIVNLFSTILEVAERGGGHGGSGREDEGYWRRANRQLCRNLVELVGLAKGRIEVHDLYRALINAPTSRDQVASPQWRDTSICYQFLSAAEKRPKTTRQQHDFGLVADYFLEEYPSLSEKTRSVIVSTFTSMIDVLNRGVQRELFCTNTTITPEATEEGKIILIDLPIKEFSEVGLFAQVLWKHAFQRSIERRNVEESPRPAFLWADEAQHFTTSYDMQFQTTCRSARVATVYLSQNVSNFYAALGGAEKGRAECDSLFANLNTKILHANGDPVTNEWAANLIGRTRQFMMNGSNSYSTGEWFGSALGMAQSQQGSTGMSEQYQFEVQPAIFTALRTGGPENKRTVDAVLFRSGRPFQSTGRNWAAATFHQAMKLRKHRRP